MRQFPFYLLAACLVSGAFFPAGSCRARVSSEGALQPADAQAVQLDSLRSLADSLARAADSLGTLLDSLISPPEPAPGPAPGKTPAIKNPWSGNFSMGLNLNRGNSDQRSLIASLRVSRKADKTRFLSSATVTNSAGSQEKSINKGSLKSKYEIEQNERFFYFASFDMNYNRQAGLDLRLAPGAGAGIALIATDKTRLNLNLGANPITEYWRDKPRRTQGHLLSSQDFSFDLNSRTRLQENFNYTPRFNQFSEYLINFSVSLTTQLTPAFDLKLNLENTYNSHPPEHDPPYKRLDWMFYTAVGYNLW